jgi:hypothetical protein
MEKREIITLAAVIPASLVAPFFIAAIFASGEPAAKTIEAPAPEIKAPALSAPKQSAANELLAYRSASETCTSNSPECVAWTEMALQCERQLAGAPVTVQGACTLAEDFREAVTGVELSSAPGAFKF